MRFTNFEIELNDLKSEIFTANKVLGKLSKSIAKEMEALLEIKAEIFHAKLENEKLETDIKRPQESELLKMRDTAKKVLVENWKMPFVEDIDRIDLDISSNFESRKCESNPELNPFIKIPKFSRNRWDYNVSRKRI